MWESIRNIQINLRDYGGSLAGCMEILLKPRALGGITRKTDENNRQIVKNLGLYGQPGEFSMKKLPV